MKQYFRFYVPEGSMPGTAMEHPQNGWIYCIEGQKLFRLENGQKHIEYTFEGKAEMQNDYYVPITEDEAFLELI